MLRKPDSHDMNPLFTPAQTHIALLHQLHEKGYTTGC